MNKSSKGALAAAAAGVLLLGGAGTLAYWTDSAEVAGGALSSGELTLTDTTAGSCAEVAWTLDDGEDVPGATFDPLADTLVPGDVLTKECTYTVGADGEHLRAELAATGGAATGALATALSVSGEFTVGAAPVTEVTEADDGDTLVATIRVTFDPASGNGTQLQDATLSDYVVSLTQVHD